MVKLTAPNGASVDVASEKVDGLLPRGFTKPAAKKAATTAPAKKSSSKK